MKGGSPSTVIQIWSDKQKHLSHQPDLLCEIQGRIDFLKEKKKAEDVSYKYKLWPVEMQKITRKSLSLCGRWELVSLQGRLYCYSTNLWILTGLVIVLQSESCFFSFFSFGKYSENSTPLSREAERETKSGQLKGEGFCRIQSEAR